MMGAFDLEWNDNDLFPSLVYPDTVFLFERMTEATLEILSVGAEQRVLDIGCGSALDCLELNRRGCWVVGLEPSQTMITQAKGWIEGSGSPVALVRAVGEHLPFRRDSFDRIVCKGALDHFSDPVKTVREMANVLKPGGKAVISIANFESLSCRLVKREMPSDHTYRFDYSLLKALMADHFEIEECIGVSLLWGLPLWGKLLAKSPASISRTSLKLLDRLARRIPAISDVIVLRCCPKPSMLTG